MAMPYDATLKDLLITTPADWLSFLHLPVDGPVNLIDADLATVSTQADQVCLVQSHSPWILHLEFQSGPDAALPRRLFKYNALLLDRHEVAAHSVVLLLRQAANRPELNGELRLATPGGPESIFRYTVVRIWELPVQDIITGKLSMLPLAPLANVQESELPRLVNQMSDRLAKEASPEICAKLWTAAYVLMGLRYERAFIDQLLQGVRAMEESVTYQAILEKGMERGFEKGIEKGIEKGESQGIVKGERSLLLLQAIKRFGEPTPSERAILESITEPSRLAELGTRILDVMSWEDFLRTP
ncbi:MAG TPA: hypothetical protein VGZ25_09730 [Gemmataceae bacterium]|nr:hypothetical protein [Gemmataceae bacterium]